MKASVFPGQGSQFPGMGKELYDKFSKAKFFFHQANEILKFDITDILFNGSKEALQATRVTQPAIFIHSVVLNKMMGNHFQPDAVAGHSLGEFSALTAAGALTFENGLSLVSKRAKAMQKACDLQPGAMAAVLGMEDSKVEEICMKIDGIVVAANYNCPRQLVISGEISAIEKACVLLKEGGARRALILPVGGAFHSPLMEPAREELAIAIDKTPFKTPHVPIYQNVTAKASTEISEIRQNLIAQLTAPVRWTQSIEQMNADGFNSFVEVGPGKVLQSLIQKINPENATESGTVK